MPTSALRKKSASKPRALKSTKPAKKTIKFTLTREDLALDNAISSAAARSLAHRRAS